MCYSLLVINKILNLTYKIYNRSNSTGRFNSRYEAGVIMETQGRKGAKSVLRTLFWMVSIKQLCHFYSSKKHIQWLVGKNKSNYSYSKLQLCTIGLIVGEFRQKTIIVISLEFTRFLFSQNTIFLVQLISYVAIICKNVLKMTNIF